MINSYSRMLEPERQLLFQHNLQKYSLNYEYKNNSVYSIIKSDTLKDDK